MSTLFLDSICANVAKGSISTTFVKAKELSQFVNAAGTNCQDVLIVFIICSTIVLIALIAMWTIWLRKIAELKILREEFANKKEKEKEESLRKQETTLLDRVHKQKTDLLDKKLKILKDLCYGEIEKKENNDSSIQKYLETIDEEIKALKECSQIQKKGQTMANENE